MKQLMGLSAPPILLQSFIEHADAVIYGKSLDGRYMIANQHFLDLLRFERHQVQGHYDYELYSAAALAEIQRREGEMLTLGGPIIFEEQVDLPGGQRRFCSTLFPLFDAQGAVVGIGGIAIELAAPARARQASAMPRWPDQQQQLNQQLAQAQRLESLGRMASGIAHDFNNLLTIMQISMGMIREHLPPDHETQAELELAERTVKSAAGLARQLLLLGSDQPQERRTADLNDLLMASMALVRRAIGRQITLVLALCGEACPVQVNVTQIEQVLINLCLNARDAMPDGGTLTISTLMVADAPRGPLVRWTVSDSGAGIAAQAMEHIFEPTFSTKPLGSGLGLFMCYHLISDHGGTISVASGPQGGAQFTIELPLL